MINTLKAYEELVGAGFTPEQARTTVSILTDAQMITKQDLQIELAPIRSDLMQLKLMIGLILGGIAALVLKTFF